MAKLTIPFSHSQIAVFQIGLENPFNDWEDIHVEQGFAWRPGSVSFSTLDEGGILDIEVLVKKVWREGVAAIRVIRVPFVVSATGVEIASIISGQTVDIQPGRYSIYYETGKKDDSYWCLFTFVPDDYPIPEIIRADSGLKPPKALFMEARPALP